MNEYLNIAVELLEEGSPAYISAFAKPLGDGLYELIAPPEYDAETEWWEFSPGSIVKLKEIITAQGKALMVASHPDARAKKISINTNLNAEAFWVQTYALDLGDGRYEVQATPHYTPEQNWEYAPGCVVRLKQMKTSSAGNWLVPEGLAE